MSMVPPMDNPIAHLPWRCERLTEHGHILLVVMKESQRTLLLRNTARRLGAPYIVCEKMRSPREFLEGLARGLCVRVPRNRHELWEDLERRLRQEPRLVVLDRAHFLTKTALRIVLDFHKMDEHRRRQTSFVLASAEQSLLKHVDSVDSGGSFISHCEYYIPGCEPTRKMRERSEAFAAAVAPPTVPFSAVVDGTAREWLGLDE